MMGIRRGKDSGEGKFLVDVSSSLKDADIWCLGRVAVQ